MPSQKATFVQTLLPYARTFERRTGIPASWALAMWANENGWNPAAQVPFGIKGKSPSGKSGSFGTWEEEGGQRVDTRAEFATYDNPAEAFEHLARQDVIRTAPRTSIQDFAQHLQKRGWATDSQYAGKIVRLAGELAGQEGGSGMIEQGENASPGSQPKDGELSEREASLKALEERIGELRAELDSKEGLRAKRAALAKVYAANLAKYEASKGQYTPDFRPVPADTASYEAAQEAAQAIKALDTQIQDRDQELARTQTAYNTLRRQAPPKGTSDLDLEGKQLENKIRQAQLDKYGRDKDTEGLDRLADRLEQGIRLGQLSEQQATARWKQALDTSAAGRQGVSEAHDLMLKAAPRMGDRKLADATVAAIRNWNNFGANVPEFSMPIFEWNPQKAMAPYMPPPEAAQQAWQTAMTTPQWGPSGDQLMAVWQQGMGGGAGTPPQSEMLGQTQAGAGRTRSMGQDFRPQQQQPGPGPSGIPYAGGRPVEGAGGVPSAWQTGMAQPPRPSLADLEAAYAERQPQPWQAGLLGQSTPVAPPPPRAEPWQPANAGLGPQPTPTRSAEDDEIEQMLAEQSGMSLDEWRRYRAQMGD